MADEITFSIDGNDGSTDEVTLPGTLLDLLAESGEEPRAEVVGDLAMFSCAERIHSAVHHTQGEPDDDLAAAEEATMALFEERFGATFGEMTGHQH